MKNILTKIIGSLLAVILVISNMTMVAAQTPEDFQGNITIEDILEKAKKDISQPAEGTSKAAEQQKKAEADKKAAEDANFIGPRQLPKENVQINTEEALKSAAENIEKNEKKLLNQPGFFSKYLPRGPENPTDIIYNIVDVIFIAAGILAVIFMIIASIQAIANFGEEEAVTKAKKMFMYTATGLIIIILAYAAVTTLIRYLFLEG